MRILTPKYPADYGLGNGLGPFSGKLPNDSGHIRLCNFSDPVLIEANYPLFVSVDGAGHSPALSRERFYRLLWRQ